MKWGTTSVSEIVKMASRADKHLSMKLARFYMKVVGFWYAGNKREQWIALAARTYTAFIVAFATFVQTVDLYHCWGDFTAVAYNVTVTLPLMAAGFKLAICILRHDTLLDLITFFEEHLFNTKYDKFGEEILRECERKGVVLLCILSCAVQGIIGSYVAIPIIQNIGKNDTDRILPFNFWVDLPLTVTPYYEIAFTIQTLSAVHAGICFFCFDNLMGILNIHVVGQFKILQHRIEILCDEYADHIEAETGFTSNFPEDYECPPSNASYFNFIPKLRNNFVKCDGHEKLLDLAERAYAELKKCIKEHLVLIRYVEKLEYVFNLILLCQMGLSSVFMCLAGFYVFVAKDGIFILQLIASFTQIFLFTWTCDGIMFHSMEIREAVFRSKWYMLPHAGAGWSFRRGLMMMMIRAERPCYITAGKFTPISLKTFSSILSTTLSYLSLMRQMGEELDWE